MEEKITNIKLDIKVKVEGGVAKPRPTKETKNKNKAGE